MQDSWAWGKNKVTILACDLWPHLFYKQRFNAQETLTEVSRCQRGVACLCLCFSSRLWFFCLYLESRIYLLKTCRYSVWCFEASVIISTALASRQHQTNANKHKEPQIFACETKTDVNELQGKEKREYRGEEWRKQHIFVSPLLLPLFRLFTTTAGDLTGVFYLLKAQTHELTLHAHMRACWCSKHTQTLLFLEFSKHNLSQFKVLHLHFYIIIFQLSLTWHQVYVDI